MNEDKQMSKASARQVGHVLIESGRKPAQAPIATPSHTAPGVSLAALPSIAKAR